MSGGAFNYLFTKDPTEMLLMENRNSLCEIMDILTDKGYPKESRMISQFIALDEKVSTLGEAIKDILYAVEWYASGDIDEDQLREKLDEFERGKDFVSSAVSYDLGTQSLVEEISKMEATERAESQITPTVNDKLADALVGALAEMLRGKIGGNNG